MTTAVGTLCPSPVWMTSSGSYNWPTWAKLRCPGQISKQKQKIFAGHWREIQTGGIKTITIAICGMDGRSGDVLCPVRVVAALIDRHLFLFCFVFQRKIKRNFGNSLMYAGQGQQLASSDSVRRTGIVTVDSDVAGLFHQIDGR